VGEWWLELQVEANQMFLDQKLDRLYNGQYDKKENGWERWEDRECFTKE
jgi:hypothetical protein